MDEKLLNTELNVYYDISKETLFDSLNHWSSVGVLDSGVFELLATKHKIPAKLAKQFFIIWLDSLD